MNLILNLNNNNYENHPEYYVKNDSSKIDLSIIDSIDEAQLYYSNEHDNFEHPINYKLSLETEFWGHFSNLKAWYENDYDTRILHRNLAFPLLKELTKVGDPLAKKVYKDEIIKRLNANFIPTIIYLLEEKYLEVFNLEELDYTIELLKDNGVFERLSNEMKKRLFYLKEKASL